MATLNSSIRSTAAAIKRADRAHQRRTKDAAHNHKIQMREQEFVTGAQALQQYNDYVDVIKSVHKEISDSIDWLEISKDFRENEIQRTRARHP